MWRWLVAAALAAGGTAVGVAEEVPRAEHPRPDYVRREWISLNGTWEFAETNEDEAARFHGDPAYPEHITVPFCREAPASGIGRRAFVKNVWYRRGFTVPAEWSSPRVRLHLNASDWHTTVYVNGERLGDHIGGNSPMAFDITAHINRGAENTVIVHAYDDTGSGLQPLGKQNILDGKSTGIFYTPTTGIWQPVWLEGVGATYVDHYRATTDPATGAVSLNVALDGASEGTMLRAEVLADSATVASAEVTARWRDNRLLLTVPEPRAWSPKDPYLYGLRLSVLAGGEVVDSVDSYIGLRTVTIEGAAILINGEPIFQRLVLDQGFYPEGIWTAPTDAELKADIERSMAAGFNGARLHQKVFEPRFLYWADQLGYLVWGEYPSYGANYDNPAVYNPITNEWINLLRRDWNHPSIIGWCPFNETPPSAAPLQATILNLTRTLDPTRPALETSGWTHTVPNPEVLDAHNYNQDPVSFREEWDTAMQERAVVPLPARYEITPAGNHPFMISEYGGIGWSLSEEAWGYGNTPKSLDEFYARFAGLTDALLDNPLLFRLCYTQLTDIEQEQNGLYTYDRQPKFELDKLHAVLSRRAAYEQQPPTQVLSAARLDWTVAVGSWHDGGSTWRYTEPDPADGWTGTEFDDRAWAEGRAPFGEKGMSWRSKIATKWRDDDIYARHTFEIDATDYERAAVITHHDDAIELWLNGELIWKHAGWTDGYVSFDLSETLLKALRPGKNTLAVHVHQDRGGQFFDMALLLGRPQEAK